MLAARSGDARRARERPAVVEVPMSQAAVSSAMPTPALAFKLALLPFFTNAKVPLLHVPELKGFSVLTFSIEYDCNEGVELWTVRFGE